MVKPAGVSIVIMVYEEQYGLEVLITCLVEGIDEPPIIEGERVETVLIGELLILMSIAAISLPQAESRGLSRRLLESKTSSPPCRRATPTPCSPKID